MSSALLIVPCELLVSTFLFSLKLKNKSEFIKSEFVGNRFNCRRRHHLFLSMPENGCRYLYLRFAPPQVANDSFSELAIKEKVLNLGLQERQATSYALYSILYTRNGVLKEVKRLIFIKQSLRALVAVIVYFHITFHQQFVTKNVQKYPFYVHQGLFDVIVCSRKKCKYQTLTSIMFLNKLRKQWKRERVREIPPE